MRSVWFAAVLLLGCALSSCDTEAAGPVSLGREDDGTLFCNIPEGDLLAMLDYLTDADRVVGLVLDGEALAVPLNILRHHEIVNLNRADTRVAVTYCPLTGSA